MFKFIFKIIALIVIINASVFIMQASQGTKCLGYNCETVKCPDNYAVKLPNGKYLPCEDFDTYEASRLKKLETNQYTIGARHENVR